MSVELKKIIDKPETRDILNKLTKEIGLPLMVKDKSGIWLYGGERQEAKNARDAMLCSIVVEGETIGWVFGGERVNNIAAVLSQFADFENEKSALAEEVLLCYDAYCDIKENLLNISVNDNCLKIIRHLADFLLSKYLPEDSAYWLAVYSNKNGQLNIVDNIGLNQRSDDELNMLNNITGSLYLQNSMELIEQMPIANSYLKSAVGVPLQIGGNAVGVIAFAVPKNNFFDHRIINKISSIGQYCSVALCSSGIVR